eukprot:2865143-Pyramimonas_sp.AAC.1
MEACRRFAFGSPHGAKVSGLEHWQLRQPHTRHAPQEVDIMRSIECGAYHDAVAASPRLSRYT